MEPLKIIIPIYLLLFVFYGIRNLKGFLLLTGILSLPLRTTYSPFYYASRTGWTGGFIISLSDISFFLLLLYLIINQKGLSKASSRIVIPMACFIAACCLSKINSTAGMLTLYQIIMMLKLSLLYYIVVANSIETEKELYSILLFITASILFQSSFAISQFFTGSAFDIFSTGKPMEVLPVLHIGFKVHRAVGTIAEPNGFAAFLTPLLLVNISLLVGLKVHKKLRFAALILGVSALIFSFSRGSWISFSLTMFVFLVIGFRQRFISGKTLWVTFLVGALLIFSLIPELRGRIISDDHNAAMSRLPLIKLAWNMIKDHPIVGVGANTFSNMMKYYVSEDLWDAWLDQVHNQYLLVFAETGLLGLLSFLWLIMSMFRESMQCVKQHGNRLIFYAGIGILFGFLASAIHMMVDIFNSPILLGSLFVLCGICTAANNLGMEKALEQEGERL